MASEAMREKQISHMIAFVRQEALEKAAEIRVKTDHDFNLEKQTKVHAAKLRIEEEFKHEVEKLEVGKRIARSKRIVDSRVRKLWRRDELLKDLLDAAKRKLAERAAADPAAYRDTMRRLIVQGLVKLDEEIVELKVRKEDAEMTAALLEDAMSEYKQLILDETGDEVVVSVTISSTHFLPPAPSDAGGASCSGGVVLAGCGGRIQCDNTLDARLMLAFGDLKPQVRSRLFPTKLSA